MKETERGKVGAACFEAGASLAWPHAGSLWPPRLSLQQVWGCSTCRPVTAVRPFHIVFKLMFSILTLFWLSGFHGPRTGVRVGHPMLQSKGFLAVPLIKHCQVSSTSVSPFPFFVSIIWEGDMPGQCHCATCRKSCFLLAQSCTGVNMSMFNRFVFSSPILFI